MRVLRVYHAGRHPGHRRREAALTRAGVGVHLAAPAVWREPGHDGAVAAEPFAVHELEVRRSGDINRHTYADEGSLRRVLADVQPDLLDLHEEPVSLATKQWLAAAGDLPVVMYTAQNLDKRFPPPFAQYERAALRQVDGMYACSRQAASVARGKGFAGELAVLPLGLDLDHFVPGAQDAAQDPIVLGLVGRMVPEKGVQDAVRVLAAVTARRRAGLRLVGAGPELEPALRLAERLGVRQAVEVTSWCSAEELARLYAGMHVVLVPSVATNRWVEQFGRVILEANACGAVVAAYDSGAIAEVVGTAGVVVREGEWEALSAAVLDVLSSPDRYRRLRAEGLAQAQTAGWDNVAEAQIRLYHRVLEAVSAGRRTHIEVGREAARAEFGAPALTPFGERPFALPILRDLRPPTRLATRRS